MTRATIGRSPVLKKKIPGGQKNPKNPHLPKGIGKGGRKGNSRGGNRLSDSTKAILRKSEKHARERRRSQAGERAFRSRYRQERITDPRNRRPLFRGEKVKKGITLAKIDRT